MIEQIDRLTTKMIYTPINICCVCREEVPPQIADSSFNISRYEYAFDMGADIEPIPATDNYAIDYDNLDCDGGNDFDDLTQGMNKPQLSFICLIIK